MTAASSREISIFLAAIEVKTDEEQAAYLDEACSNDVRLRAHIEELIAAHRRGTSFLERPAPGLDHTVDVDRGAMDAGFAHAFGPDEAVVVGGSGHSVLKSLSKSMPDIPHVTLHDSTNDPGVMVQPGSGELPTKQDDSRYQLLGEIARGGMGAIIKGRDMDLGRDLAVKVLLDSHKDRPEVVQRFVEEAQIGGQLQHPGIVPVYELGQFSDQRPFFSMKLVKGETLAALLGKRKDPSEDLPKLLGIFEQVCQTMAYAHSKGVIHRDLKPSNIMVGAFGEVQVMDWGLSKVLRKGGVDDERKSLHKHRGMSVIQTRRSAGTNPARDIGSQTQMGSVLGTPAYMPPEQALGEVDRLDKRADVFALGAVLCEILTGKPPYVGDDTTQVFRQASRGKLDECFTRLDECGVEQELITLAKRALAADPEERLSDASDAAEGATTYLNNVQVRLREAELASAKAQIRRRLSVAIAALMLLIAVGSTIAAAYFREQRAVLARLNTELAKKNRLISQRVMEQAFGAALCGNEPRTKHFLKTAADSSSESYRELILGVMEWQRNQLTAAISHLERAAELDKGSLAARALLSSTYLSVGNADKYYALRRELASLQPKTAEDYLLRAWNGAAFKRDAGVRDVERALEMRKSPVAQAIHGAVLSYKALAARDITMAEKGLQELAEAQFILGTDGNFLTAHRLACLMVCISLSQPETEEIANWKLAAEKCATQLMNAPVVTPYQMWLTGNYYDRVQDNDPAAAREAFERMVEVESGDVWVALYAGVLLRDRSIEAALQAFEATKMRTNVRNAFEWTLSAIDSPTQIDLRSKWADGQVNSRHALVVANALGMRDEARAMAKQWTKSGSKGNQILIDFIVDNGTPDPQLQEQIDSEDTLTRLKANNLVALKYLADGDRVRAKEYFQRVVDTGYYHSPAYIWAEGYLEQMKRDTEWPRSKR